MRAGSLKAVGHQKRQSQGVGGGGRGCGAAFGGHADGGGGETARKVSGGLLEVAETAWEVAGGVMEVAEMARNVAGIGVAVSFVAVEVGWMVEVVACAGKAAGCLVLTFCMCHLCAAKCFNTCVRSCLWHQTFCMQSGGRVDINRPQQLRRQCCGIPTG